MFNIHPNIKPSQEQEWLQIAALNGILIRLKEINEPDPNQLKLPL